MRIGEKTSRSTAIGYVLKCLKIVKISPVLWAAEDNSDVAMFRRMTEIMGIWKQCVLSFPFGDHGG